MPENQQPASNTGATTSSVAAGSTPITPELVRQVAERVYAMLLHDLRLGRERRRQK